MSYPSLAELQTPARAVIPKQVAALVSVAGVDAIAELAELGKYLHRDPTLSGCRSLVRWCPRPLVHGTFNDDTFGL
jgi:hypothetical protein